MNHACSSFPLYSLGRELQTATSQMTHGSLFSGIGGFDLAAEWCGWDNVFQVEIDPFCQRVLQKNFPNAQRFSDIREFDGLQFRGTIDVLSGGFPCQPYSTAGQRRGAADDRALWPEMLRVVAEIQPAWIVCENVAGIRNMGLENMLSDLEALGYETAVFVVPACAVGCDTLRTRVWVVAHSNSLRELQPNRGIPNIRGRAAYSSLQNIGVRPFPDKSSLSRTAYGLPGRVDGRGKRIKSLGNAIVPQVAYQIFQAIQNVNPHLSRHEKNAVTSPIPK